MENLSPLLYLSNDKCLRVKHQFSPEAVAHAVAEFITAMVLLKSLHVPAVIADAPDNDIVLTTAVAGEAVYIVSGDPHLLTLREYQGIHIFAPSASLMLLATRYRGRLTEVLENRLPFSRQR